MNTLATNPALENIARPSGIEDRAFFYIDGIPTKGRWIDLDLVGAWEDVQHLLSVVYPSAVIDEVLCADAEGFARYFLSRHDCFDLDSYLEFMDEKKSSHLDDAVVMAYIENCGAEGVSISDIEEAFLGEYDSWTDFAEQFADETGMLSDMPESLRFYFDFERFGSDLSYDHFESNGYYFRNL